MPQQESELGNIMLTDFPGSAPADSGIPFEISLPYSSSLGASQTPWKSLKENSVISNLQDPTIIIDPKMWDL